MAKYGHIEADGKLREYGRVEDGELLWKRMMRPTMITLGPDGLPHLRPTRYDDPPKEDNDLYEFTSYDRVKPDHIHCGYLIIARPLAEVQDAFKQRVDSDIGDLLSREGHVSSDVYAQAMILALEDEASLYVFDRTRLKDSDLLLLNARTEGRLTLEQAATKVMNRQFNRRRMLAKCYELRRMIFAGIERAKDVEAVSDAYYGAPWHDLDTP